ncbi:MAG: cell division protein FtsQ/DivIB, partial [Silicimonas sp.]|nr:cell division protein FtsQ/DivIB [Silicimonas sp.]
VEEIDAVAAASVRIRQGGVLEVDVVERVPVAIWRTAETLALLDPGGHRVAPLEARDLRPDLPLIAGKGADRELAEALAILAVAEPIAGRMRGLVRVGERRWDVVLDRGQRILLPETKPVTALEKVIALDQAQDLLARDIANVDFRNPKRPVLRLTPSAIETLYDTYLTSSEGQTE